MIDQIEAATVRLKQAARIGRIGNLAEVKPRPFVGDDEACAFGGELGSDRYRFARIALVAMLDGVDDGFVERNDEFGIVRLYLYAGRLIRKTHEQRLIEFARNYTLYSIRQTKVSNDLFKFVFFGYN